MAAMSSGTRGRPTKKLKGGTTSTRKHRFETFTQRIAKLDINPIRRVRNDDIDHGDVNITTSFFKTGIDRWKNLNLSENFTDFVREAEPLSDSLPQILHHSDRILDLLVVYIEKRDSQSLEPLFSLLGNFAHDLGTQFEKHFLQAVKLVVSLATAHVDVQVIEWSFTCLAWLFKYLSRLLVPDLGPLFQIMAPLLGREPQKTHILRFSAEAMSFLVRRAALAYHRNPSPLKIIVDYILTDTKSLPGHIEVLESYQLGLMTLLVDSMKGIDRNLHSCGDSIYRCLLEGILDMHGDWSSAHQEILNGVTIGLLHHTDSITFQPILDIILPGIENKSTTTDRNMSVFEELLFIVVTVRKGSRIRNWYSLFDALRSLLAFRKTSAIKNPQTVYKAAAVLLQSAPLENVICTHRQILDMIADDCNTEAFLSFCSYFSDLGRERLQDLLSPYISR